MTARILAGSVFDMLPTITPGSVDCVVTSPPYWMLRSYLPKGHELKPQELGSEPTVQEFIGNMVRVFGLVRETMADHAVCFCNIGDSYGQQQGKGFNGNAGLPTHGDGMAINRKLTGIESGNLCLIPQRLAIALQDDGWIIRSVIVWHKPAPMPASVSGWMFRRCRVKVANGWTKETHPANHGSAGDLAHSGDIRNRPIGDAQWSDCPGCEKCEKNGGLVLRRGSWRPTSSWEPILMLAKSPNYYADGEAVKTPSAGNRGSSFTDPRDELLYEGLGHGERVETGMANPRDVQTWASEPLKEKHYAAFPTALVRFCLRAGTSLRGYCPTCGAPWARIVETDRWNEREERRGMVKGESHIGQQQRLHNTNGQSSGTDTTTLGWRPTCRCPEQEPRPALVLDPFSGSARTGLTAIRMGLDYVGVELSPIYCELSRKLLNAENPLFNRVESE